MNNRWNDLVREQRDAGGGRETAKYSSSTHEDSKNPSWIQIPYSQFYHPPARSGAASAVYKGRLYVYGGFGGSQRLSDMHFLDLATHIWTPIHYVGNGPEERENNGMMVVDDYLYLFGGYNGSLWLRDLHVFDPLRLRWHLIEPQSDLVPSPRFGFVSAAFEGSLIIWAGYDGLNWLNDLFVFSLKTNTWRRVECEDGVSCPSVRSCPSWTQDGLFVYIFGGFDGINTLNDFWKLDLQTMQWTEIIPKERATVPCPRYFHSSALFKNQVLVYGGFGHESRLGDLHMFDLGTGNWSEITTATTTVATGSDLDRPCGRSSLVMHVHDDIMYVFGGFNGKQVLDDLYRFPLRNLMPISPSTLGKDMMRLVNHDTFYDVTFRLDDETIVKGVSSLMAVRSEHFRAMLFGGMMETTKRIADEPIYLSQISAHTFVQMLEWMYTDKVHVQDVEEAVSLLVAGDRFLLGDRLKALCVEYIRPRLSVGNVIQILLLAASQGTLKELCMEFAVSRFEAVKQTDDFLLLRSEPELLMELVLRL